ncbi:concanavalin A-like lectin/glucanase domain-containing protein [Glomus cerebriforme]|uniref:Concanavalin A-like lectin/glucanase domain-containing protein n=1 Tax=Glomus cerebriforme TaxID=658196 RepID=A0A397S8T7_9GLOM|nr:concanavalin A-like lectin/glucanase domain-containing protein [Glomus cerebriforme]
MKESYERQISFPRLDSSEIKIILEYLYTGSINKESLNKDNIIETYLAADYFQLTELQNILIELVKVTLETMNIAPELLSKAVGKLPSLADNELLNLLVESVSLIPLNSIEIGRLSFLALQHILSYTYENEIFFMTSEYQVFRYSVTMAAKRVSDNATKIIDMVLPDLNDDDDSSLKSMEIDDFNIYRQQIVEELKPLTKYIDFKLIQGSILANIIEPLNIIPMQVLFDAYRYHAKSNYIKLNKFRGYNKSNLIWDDTACGSKLIIKDNGGVVCASNCVDGCQTVRSKFGFCDIGIYEWDIIIEKYCANSWIGICDSINIDYEKWAGLQTNAWVLGSNGSCYNNFIETIGYCPPFGEGDIITVHLNMNERSCAFSINGRKYPPVTTWNNLPSKLYPAVSLFRPGQFRIQLH